MKYILIISMVFMGGMAAPSPTNNTLWPSEYPTLIFRRPGSGSGLTNPLECADNGIGGSGFKCSTELKKTRQRRCSEMNGGNRLVCNYYKERSKMESAGPWPLADSVINEIR